jgi:hypothetical protein
MQTEDTGTNMNTDTTPTPRMNEVASDYVSDTPITSDLLEKLKKPSDGDGKDLITLCREFERELAEKTNEVARLRELLTLAIEIADGLVDPFTRITGVPEQGLAKLAALAPTPKEPANPTCSNTTHKFSHCDCETPTPIQPEWRELGPDEVIQEGDEFHVTSADYWKKVTLYIGCRLDQSSLLRVRTRRPLPKQEEMPLEREIAELETGRVVEVMSNGMKISENPDPKLKAVATCLRYLRDEIQKLKHKNTND